MKKEPIAAILYYLAAILFFVAAAIDFLGQNDTAMGVTWLCLGSTMLCLGTVWLNKWKTMKITLNLEKLEETFSVCTVANYDKVDLEATYCFTGKTDTERSLVCPTDKIPPETLTREDSWKALRVQGTLDFSLIGILAEIANQLAKKDIGIFVISTYRTDYILVKAAQFDDAIGALTKAGHHVQ